MKHDSLAKSKQYREAGIVYYVVDGNCAALRRVQSEVT